MGWQRNYVVLTTGARVRFSFVQRNGSDVYRARFKGPDGKLVELSTGCSRKLAEGLQGASHPHDTQGLASH